jgi:hypothetical protein
MIKAMGELIECCDRFNDWIDKHGLMEINLLVEALLGLITRRIKFCLT